MLEIVIKGCFGGGRVAGGGRVGGGGGCMSREVPGFTSSSSSFIIATLTHRSALTNVQYGVSLMVPVDFF